MSTAGSPKPTTPWCGAPSLYPAQHPGAGYPRYPGVLALDLWALGIMDPEHPRHTGIMVPGIPEPEWVQVDCTHTLLSAAVLLRAREAAQFLRPRQRRAYQVFEEAKQGHLERECVEEVCSKEEAREVFENDPETVSGRQGLGVGACASQNPYFWVSQVLTPTLCRSRNPGDCGTPNILSGDLRILVWTAPPRAP